MTIFGGTLTWIEHIWFGTAWLFSSGPYSMICHSSSQNYNKLCDQINFLNHRKVLNFSYRKTFPRFTELPYEIRIQIWKEVVPQGRIIELRRNWKSKSVDAITKIPAMLQACHESRSVALQTYHLSFGSTSTLSTIYASFAHDTIFFGRRYDFYDSQNWYVLRDERARARRQEGEPEVETAMVGFDEIERLALKFEYWPDWQVMASDLQLMPKLREVVLVRQGENKAWDLGPEPELKRYSNLRQVEMLSNRISLRTVPVQAFADELQTVLWQNWMEMGKNEESVPKVVVGSFVKGPTDKWFMTENMRGLWPF